VGQTAATGCARCGRAAADDARFCSECGAPLGESVLSNEARDQRVGDVLRAFVSGPVADRLVEDALVEDRRTVTAVFADLSGFTALAGSLEPVELARVIDPVVAGLTRIVDRYGGAVEKFAGDAILAFFGAPIAHEDDAERAVMAALEMHEQLPLLSSHPAAQTLSLHVGINTGEVYARMVGSQARLDYAVLGEAVVLAQRLESLAPTGTTYVGAETARMVRDGLFVFEDLGALAVKGRAEPVPAVRLVGRVPAARAEVGGGRAIVARAAERAALEQVLDGGCAVLVGDAGGGKSTLARWVEEQARARGLGVVRLAAASYGAGAPYLPFVRLLSDVDGLADPLLQALVEPTGGDPLSGLEPEAARSAVSRSLVAWMRSHAADGRLLVVVEDLHWTDDATLGVVVDLVRTPGAAPAVIATSRPGAPGIETLVGAGADAVPLGPLDEAGIQELLAGELGGEPDARVVSLVLDRTEGNPLFAVELVARLVDDGAVVPRDGRWRLSATAADADLPRNVSVLFGARVDELPPLLADTLAAAAMSGSHPSTGVVARVLELDAETAAERLDRLVRMRLLVDDAGRRQFRHALLRDAVLERLSPARSRDLHLRSAEATACELPPGPEASAAIGAHLYEGGALRLALPYLVSAADDARAVYAHAEAAESLRRAARSAGEQPKDPRLAAILQDLGDSLEALGDYEGAVHAFTTASEEAEAAADLDLLVSSREHLVAVKRRTGAYDDALAAVDDALASLPDGADPRRLLLERARTLYLLGRMEHAAAAVAAGLGRGGGDATFARLLTERGWQSARVGSLDAAADDLDAAIPLLDSAEDLSGLVTALMFRGEVHERSGQLEPARATYRRALERAGRLGRVEERAAVLNNLGFLALAVEDWAEAERVFAAAAEEFAMVGHRAGVAMASGNRGYALMHLGDLDEAARLAESAATSAAEVGLVSVEADTLTTRAMVAQRQGDEDGARIWAERACETAERSGDPDIIAAAQQVRDSLGGG
jgi:class 3 adenylate cyclase/tetratricopeptide (TPR) repeat protein